MAKKKANTAATSNVAAGQTPAKVGYLEYTHSTRAEEVNAKLTAASKDASVRDAGAATLDSLKGESGVFAFKVGDDHELMKNDEGKAVAIWYPVNLEKEDGTLCRTSTSTIRRSLKSIIPAPARRSTGDMVAYLESIQDDYNIDISECGTNDNGRTIFKGSFVKKS